MCYSYFLSKDKLRYTADGDIATKESMTHVRIVCYVVKHNQYTMHGPKLKSNCYLSSNFIKRTFGKCTII